MDGIHDMGGMHGLGPLEPTREEPLSKSDWGLRTFCIELSYTQPGGFNVNWLRHMMECMTATAYLTTTYYDRWYWRDAAVLANGDWVSVEELTTGKATSIPEDAGDPVPPEAVSMILEQGLESRRPDEGDPRYGTGDRVRATFHSPLGATRLPRYVRGHVGTVERYHGWHILPDANAHGDARAEPLYCVAFAAQDLWDDAAMGQGTVFADLWESYLEPA